MYKLCVRGGGNLCKKLILDIKCSGDKKHEVVYVADTDKLKQGSKIENIEVGGVNNAIELYQKDFIHKFVIFYNYGFKVITEMAKELLEKEVLESDILIFQNKKFYTLKQIMRLFKFQMYSLLNEHDYKHEKIIAENDSKYQLYGSNWLSKYIDGIITKNGISQNNIHLICAEGKELDDSIIDEPDNNKIYLYNIFYYYFFSNAMWFHTLKTEVKKTNITGLATGISTIREAIKDKKIINLSNSQQDIYYDFCMLKKYCNVNNNKPSFVIMGLGPLSLCYDMSISEITNNTALLYYPEVKTMHNHKYAAFYEKYFDNEYGKIKYLFPEINVEECFDNYYFLKMKKIFDMGKIEFNEQKLSEKDKEIIKNNITNLFYNSGNENTVNENKRIIIDYLDFCKSKEIPVIVFYPPYSDFYKKEIDTTIFEQVKDYINSLKNIFDIKILDLSNLCLSDDLFYDYIHLNNKGTEYIRPYIDNAIDKVLKIRGER